MRTIVLETERVTAALKERASANGKRCEMLPEELKAIEHLLSTIYVGGIQQVGGFSISFRA